MKILKPFSFCILTVLTCSFILSGCDNSSSSDHSSSQPVPPEPPTPEPPTPEANVPSASDIVIRTLHTSEMLQGAYLYSDKDNRAEGNTLREWTDSEGNVLSTQNPLPVTLDIENKTIKYCVQPVTFDGVSGEKVCSASMNIQYDAQPVTYSTDWNSDTDATNDVNPWYNNLSRNVPAGNVHFYYNIDLTPLSPESTSLKKISAGEERKIERNFYDYFDLDNVYTSYDDNKVLTLTNNTIRSLKDPVIRVKSDDYYYLDGYTLPPFTTVQINGVTIPDNAPVAFVETSPAFKGQVNAYDQGDTLKQSMEHAITDVFSGKYDKRKMLLPVGRNTVADSSSVLNEEQAEMFNQLLRSLKLGYNRFDTIKFYFDSFENFKTFDGVETGQPFSNMLTYYLEPLNGTCNDFSVNACGLNGVTAKYAYRVNAYKRIISHAADTTYSLYGETGGYSTSEPYGISTTGLSEGMFSTVVGIDVVNHENAHSLGYNEDSGLAYGWSDMLHTLMMKMDFFPVKDGIMIDTAQPVIEASDYYADYHWIDPTTVDVHFYAKYSNARPIKNIAILAGDEESLLSFPNFCGDWGASSGADGCDPAAMDFGTYSSFNADGSIMLDKQLTKINNNTIRIKLTNPIKNNSKSLFVFASSADTNDNQGVWKTDYSQSVSDSFAIQIPYDKEINVVEGNIAYVTSLTDNDAILRYGSTGHIGKNGEYDVGLPNYLLPDTFYNSYTAAEAEKKCIDTGYKGIGVLSFEPSDSENDPLALKIGNYIINGTIIGYAKNNPQELEMVQQTLKNGTGYRTGDAYSIVKDVTTDKANVIVCRMQ